MNNTNLLYTILVFLLVTGGIACTNQQNDTHHGHVHDDTIVNDVATDETEAHHDEGFIHLSEKQINTIGLELGSLSEIKISDYVKSTGTLGLPPNSYASVSAKSEGHIKNAYKYVEGSKVKNGAIIAYLENPKLIKKQELFYTAHAQLIYLEQAYQRQKSLFDQDAGIEKDVQKLYADVQIKRAQKLSAEKYLNYLGINTNEVLSGNFIKRIPIKAPITGFITSINMHNGMFVKPEQQLLEIVSDDHLHLELDVFERDIASIKDGQKISYQVPALGNQFYEGEVHVIGKEFDTHNKTVRVHGHLNGVRPQFIKDLFITAKIWLNDQKVSALPEESVMKDGPVSFIYFTRTTKLNDHGEMEFEKIMVHAGPASDGYVSVSFIDPFPEEAKIVTKGSYFLYAQSKYGEATHEH